jgi:hypothetical protein
MVSVLLNGEKKMLPIVHIRVWTWADVGNVCEHQKRTLIVPDGAKFLSQKNHVHLDLDRGREAIRMGEAKIVRQVYVPLSCLDEVSWKDNIGPSEKDAYILSVRNLYGLRNFSIGTSIDLLYFDIVFLENKFKKLVAANRA